MSADTTILAARDLGQFAQNLVQHSDVEAMIGAARCKAGYTAFLRAG